MELTQEKLKQYLFYDPLTGFFTWKIKRNGSINIGSTAGFIHKKGYGYICLFGKEYRTHRLAWLYMEGFFPKNIDIDHIDKTKHHNWWSNLRLLSRQCNIRNSGNPITNTSGVKGACWDKNRNRWKAKVIVNGKVKSLGNYKSFDNAVCARLAGEQCLGWEGCDSSSPAYQYVQKNIIGVNKQCK